MRFGKFLCSDPGSLMESVWNTRYSKNVSYIGNRCLNANAVNGLKCKLVAPVHQKQWDNEKNWITEMKYCNSYKGVVRVSSKWALLVALYATDRSGCDKLARILWKMPPQVGQCDSEIIKAILTPSVWAVSGSNAVVSCCNSITRGAARHSSYRQTPFR